jgi:hypothetical protein
VIVSFPPFEPDKAPYNSAATAVAVNALPIADGWGPMPSLVPLANALASAPRGSITARLSTGVQVTIAGTATGLYLVNNNGTLTDVSGPSAPYAVPDGDEWSFDVFGARIIATNLNDVVQYYDIGTSTDFADLPGTPPKARFVKVIGDFVALFQLNNDAAAIHWSGINNSEQWVPGEELCDTNSFPDGEELQAISVNGSGATLAFRSGFRSMIFDPSSGYVFTFSPFAEGRGCAAPLSLVDIGRGDFVYYSDTGFYRGASATPIGAERVDRWIQTVTTDGTRSKIKGVYDPFRKVVMWRYEDASGNGYILGYAWQLDRWFQSDTIVTGLGVFATSAKTLEDLDAISSSIDLLPFSLDSSAYGGGPPSFAGFDASFRLGFFTGLPQQATIETGQTEFSPGSRSFVSGLRAISDSPGITIAIGILDSHDDTPTWTAQQARNSRSFMFDFRADGRLHAFRAIIPAEDGWSALSALNVNGIPSGGL